jgi:uncharacterized repeat protein (TIGR03806 family)
VSPGQSHQPAPPAKSPTLAELAAPKPLEVADLPAGFSEQIVATGITGATALAVAPDGRLFVCEQTGALRVVRGDTLLDEPFVTMKVDSSWERGLIGVALDPDFPKAPHVYVCYVAPEPYPHHRVSRFTAAGDVAVPGSEVVLLRGDDQTKLGGKVPNGHQGGAIHFGKDGKLYVGIGEQTAGLPSQRLDTFQGKLLRINPDGSIPPDNPFFATAAGKYRAIWALGLRNPYAFAVQPGTGRIFINDVGEARWEEINEGAAGANYGWPHAEGYSADPQYRNPVHAYDHGQGRSITGGAFYNPAVEQLPKEYVGKYFFADYIDNWIRILDPDNPRDVKGFATGLAGPTDLQVGPDGSLYYVNRNVWVKDGKFQPRTGSVHRIVYAASAATPAPYLTAQPDERTVAAGEPATFAVAAAGEAPLRYQWRRDGVLVEGATAASYTLYAATGAADGARFECVVSNARGRTRSRAATLWVTSLRPSAAALPSVGGLEYAYYEGAWAALPDFDRLRPVRIGVTAGADLSPRTRDEDFGVVFRGFIDVAKDGAYTFFLTANGASKLFVASADVAGTGPGPGLREAAGTVGLKARKHPFLLSFAHGAGRPDLDISYAGPGLPRQPVPRSAFSRTDRNTLVAPQVEPAGGDFTGPVLVRLTAPTAGATIRYTADGTEPTAGSAVYRGPFLQHGSATITARTFTDAGPAGSAVTAATFRIRGTAPYGLPHRELATTVQARPTPSDWPPLLSQTGAFRSLADLTPNPGVVPYAVNAPLWSDGAAKRRWIALPGDARIGFAAAGEWRFPAGTVFVKHFEIATHESRPDLRKRLETRLLVVDKGGSGSGVTYKWRADGTEADLLPETSLTEAVATETASGPGKLVWTYPSRIDCLVCHTAAAGFVLGVNARQLNGTFAYPATGVTDNQLRTWNHLGMFDRAVPEDEIPGYPRLVAVTDATASLEHRVRSYLDSNCAQCHRPGGTRVAFDARFDTPPERQHLVAGPVVSSDLGVPNAALVAPQDPARSMIYRRMVRRQDAFNMPPLATREADREAIAVLERWIMSLPGGAKPASRPPPK